MIDGVPTDPPPPWEAAGRREAWLYVLESLAGGVDDDGMLKWLRNRETFEDAYADAHKLRGGQIAT